MVGGTDRRAFLAGVAATGGFIGASTRAVGGRQEGCTPGHDDGDAPCRQVDDDATVLTAFPAAETALAVTFDYPCGWRASTTAQFEDRSQANVTRDDFDAYADVQVRCYYEPVPADYIDEKRESGDYVDLEYDFRGETRTGIVTSRETADFGTTGHAVVPFGQALVHVELVSTLKGTDCSQPRPDFDLVRDMLVSLRPNPDSTFAEENPHVDAPAQVTISDQVVREGGTLVTVDSVFLPDDGFITVHDATELRAGSPRDSIIGVSRFLEEGTFSSINIRLDADEALTEMTEVVARVHRDTNDNQVFDHPANADIDGPYRAGGSPVRDSATITVHTPVPTPTMSPTETAEGPTVTPTSARTPTKTGLSNETPTETPNDATEGSGPGFGLLAAVAGVAAGVAARWADSPEEE